jgi:hypothetical protein
MPTCSSFNIFLHICSLFYYNVTIFYFVGRMDYPVIEYFGNSGSQAEFSSILEHPAGTCVLFYYNTK